MGFSTKYKKKNTYPVKIVIKGLSKEQLALIDKLKKEYDEKKKAIIEDTKEEETIFREAWKPAQYEYERDLQLQELKRQRQGKLVYQTDEEYNKAVARIEQQYQKKLKDFNDVDKQIQKIEKKYSNADAILTSTEQVSIYKWFGNNNTLIFGGSGCGKTRNFLVPNVLQAHSSFVITDPKGEILEKTGYFLSKVKGYNIRVLNLDAPKLSDCYNPFHYIHPERDGYEERVLSLIKTIIMNTNGGEDKSGSDPFWEQAEQCFLQALFFFTCVYFKKEEQNINTMLRLLSMLKLEEDKDDQDSALDIWVREEFIPKYGKDHIGVQQYNEFRDKAAGKTAKSIVMSAVARFAPFRTKEIRRILSADSMNLEMLGEQKTAVFVVVPPTDTTFNFMAGMLFSQMFQELQYCATQVHKAEGQRLPVPVRFLLDEFANTCKIPQFVQIIAYARSFGIGICPILQSLEQLKKMFDKDWGTVIDNCWSMLYLGGVTHPDTLEYLVKLVGKGTFDKKSTSQTKGRNGSNSTSYDKIGRELLDMSEIRQLPSTDCLLFLGGRPAFWSKKYDYPSHTNYKWTSDGNSRFHYDYTPVPIVDEEKVLREKEEELHRQEQAEKARIRKEAQAALTKKATEEGQAEGASIIENIDKEVDFMIMNRPTTATVGTFIHSTKKGSVQVVTDNEVSNGYKMDVSAEEPFMEDIFEDKDKEFVSAMNGLDGGESGISLEKESNNPHEQSHGETATIAMPTTEDTVKNFEEQAEAGAIKPLNKEAVVDGYSTAEEHNDTEPVSHGETDTTAMPNTEVEPIIQPLSEETVKEFEDKAESGEVIPLKKETIVSGYTMIEDLSSEGFGEDDLSFDTEDFNEAMDFS